MSRLVDGCFLFLLPRFWRTLKTAVRLGPRTQPRTLLLSHISCRKESRPPAVSRSLLVELEPTTFATSERTTAFHSERTHPSRRATFRSKETISFKRGPFRQPSIADTVTEPHTSSGNNLFIGIRSVCPFIAKLWISLSTRRASNTPAIAKAVTAPYRSFPAH
jgi:hypothetical protein